MISLSRIIKNWGGAIQALKSRFSQTYNANPGDNLKIDSSGKINCGKIINMYRAATDGNDISELSRKTISMKEIFTTWNKISCDAGYSGRNQNGSDAESVAARSAYYYDDKNEVIVCTRNSEAYSAFVSQDKYPVEYTINFRLDNRIIKNLPGASDDDLINYIVAYMVDGNGIFHAITLNRTGNTDQGQHEGYQFTLGYDYFTAFPKSSHGFIILDNSTKLTTKNNWYNNYVICQCKKTATTIECLTADPNQDTYNQNYKLSFTLPTTKPADWSQEAYDNIKYMMSNRCQIGFGTHSNLSAFKIDSQTGLFDEISVYDLSSGQKKIYKEGVLIRTEAVKDTIEPNTLIYSALNEKLFYCREPDSVTELGPASKIKTMQNQIAELKIELANIKAKIAPND